MILKRIVFLHLLFLIVFFQTVSSSSGGNASLSTSLHTGQSITAWSVSLTTTVAFSTGTVSSTISVKATTTTVNSVQPTTTLQVHSSSVSVTGKPKTSTIEIKAIDSTEGTSLKARLLYIFFAAFGGVVLLLAICVAVVCRIGKNGVKENDVRPLTISSLELTENQR
ncbi:uncharacterized protein LOC141883507 [Acropora palmata]|uniref:uncharacterized protein LOC141883507 n=1 Tax=Acropora palmata TaxID=6131 RepID=UPI003DA01B44